MKRSPFRDQRGSALLFTTVLLVFLLWIGGLAVDLAYFAEAKGELQRSLDAAALAGAGKLAFDSSVFDTVRATAQAYAGANHYRDPQSGNVNLSPSDIDLGVWSGTAFTAWNSATDPNGLTVNAVRCRWSMPVPMSFLRLLGFDTMTVSAMATAISNPPTVPGCNEPLVPLAVTQCSFYDGGTGAFTSSGCGTGLTFIRSQKLCNNSPGSPQACNTGSWSSLDGSTPTDPYLRNAIQNAGNPAGVCPTAVPSGGTTTLNNGMLNNVFDTLATTFVSKRIVPLSEDVCPAGGCDGSHPPTYPKSGGGWEIAVQMVKTSCPPGPMSGTAPVLTYAKFVVTQVFDQNKGCVVNPNPDPQAQQYCYNADGSPKKDPDLRAVFGYFRCDKLGDVAAIEPLPRAALAPRLRLVQ